MPAVIVRAICLTTAQVYRTGEAEGDADGRSSYDRRESSRTERGSNRDERETEEDTVSRMGKVAAYLPPPAAVREEACARIGVQQIRSEGAAGPVDLVHAEGEEPAFRGGAVEDVTR